MFKSKRVSRAQLRGKQLDEDCKTANTTTNEYGNDDKRVYCFGLYVDMTDWKIQKKCISCKAYIENITPYEG